MNQGTQNSGERGRWHRLKRYMTSVSFRYKIAAYVFGAMLLACGLYTLFVWGTTRQLSQQIKLSTDARAQAANISRELHHSALTKELLSEFQDEAFIQSLQKRSEEIDAQYEEEMKQVADSQKKLLSRQKQVFWVWMLGFGLITVVLVFFSVVLSRRIASPVQDIQEIVESVSRGELKKKHKDLQASGEFHALHVSTMGMIDSLRTKREHIVSEVKTSLSELESPMPHKGIERLRRLVKALEEELKEERRRNEKI